MEKTIYPFGIAKTDNSVNDLSSKVLDAIKKDYDLSDEVMDRLVYAHLFRLSDYFQFTQFDADIVLYDEQTGYYAIGEFEPCNVNKDDVVALVDENSECEPI